MREPLGMTYGYTIRFQKKYSIPTRSQMKQVVFVNHLLHCPLLPHPDKNGQTFEREEKELKTTQSLVCSHAHVLLSHSHNTYLHHRQ